MLRSLRASALGAIVLLGLFSAKPVSAQTTILTPSCNNGSGGIVGQIQTIGPQAGGTCGAPVQQAGSPGTDYSANTPTLPNVGANFAASGPYASYVLVKTIPAASTGCVHVENDSGAQIALVLDDGTAANGSAPVNGGVFALGGGSGTGSQGGSTGQEFCAFKGRVQVYAPSSSAQVFSARW